MRSLLVFSKTTDYRHESIPAGVAAVAEIGVELGFTVDATEDADMFDAAILSRYAAVVFLSPSGTIFETGAQRAALESYVVSGGGFVGIHAASTAESDWPFYGEPLGGRFKSHPPLQPATVIVEDGSHRPRHTSARPGRSPMSGTSSPTTHGHVCTYSSRWTSRPTREAPWGRAIPSPGSTPPAPGAASTPHSATQSRFTPSPRSGRTWPAESALS